MRVAIVTDSASDLSVSDLGRLCVSVVSLGVAGVETVSVPGVPVMEQPERPRIATLTRVDADPLAAAFTRTYEQLACNVDAILSLHVSSRLANVVDAARTARERLRGVVPIEVVDSGVASVALGFVVRRVADAARRGADLADLDFLARRAAQNVHAMFFAESVDYIRRDNRWSREHGWPIAGNGSRPILLVEDGEVRPLERVRTRARGYDRLAEFVEFFPHVDHLAVLHDTGKAELENLLKRLEPIYPRAKTVIGEYGPMMRAQIGPRAIGVIVDQGIDYD